MTSNTASLKAPTNRWAKVGPIPLERPEPKYFSMPSAEVGAVTRKNVALNCNPCSRWFSDVPLA